MSCNCIINAIAKHTKNSIVNNLQCSLCFLDCESEGGVNLCLHTLESFCGEHQVVHFSKHENFLQFVNIRKHTERKEYTGEVLGVGVEGGADNDIITYSYTINCLNCDSSVDFTDSTIENLPFDPQYIDILRMILTKDPLIVEKMSEWQLHLAECKHVKELQNLEAQINLPEKLKCRDCDLDANLWLCLKCGNLGCGRKYYDGTGGNNHGVDHFHATQHGVNLKIGTLSAELDKCSLYCYKCDDDVKFNNIGGYLKTNFNIDYKKFNKTEKSIIEMSLDANMRLELSKSIEKDVNLTPARISGITNLGNTCYANSVWQCVSHAKLFDKFITQYQEHSLECSRSNYNCIVCQRLRLYQALKSNEFYSEIKTKETIIKRGLNPYMYRNVVCKNHQEFSSSRQQDAYEFLNFYLEGSKQHFDVNQLEIVTAEVRHCSMCNSKKAFTSKSFSLLLDKPEDVSTATENVQFNQFLNNMFKARPQDLTCDNCNKITPHTVQTKLYKTSDLLILGVQRLQVNYQEGSVQKCNFSMNFDENVDIKPYFMNAEEYNAVNSFQPDMGIACSLTDMGLTWNQACWACKLNNNDGEKIQFWVGNNFDTLYSYDNENYQESVIPMGDTENCTYKVESFVTHVGAGYGTGHYIAHYKTDKWVYLNDESTYYCDKTTQDKAYVYFLRKI